MDARMAAIAVDGFLMWWLFFSLFSRINSTFFELMEWNHIMLCEFYAARYCQLTMVTRVNLILRSSLFASTKWLPWHSYSENSDRQSQPQYVMTFNFSTLLKDPILFWHLRMYVWLQWTTKNYLLRQIQDEKASYPFSLTKATLFKFELMLP